MRAARSAADACRGASVHRYPRDGDDPVEDSFDPRPSEHLMNPCPISQPVAAPGDVYSIGARVISLLVLFITWVFPAAGLRAQAFAGYTLYSVWDSRTTILVDMNNQVAHTWPHNRNGGYSAYLLSDGSVLRSATSGSPYLNYGPAAGIVQRVAWDGTLIWEYTYSGTTYRSHHDIEPMPNGNVMLIAWEVKTASQCVAAGLDHSASLWPDHIVEIQPSGSSGGTVVWEWHVWDHLIQNWDASKSNYGVVAQHPELIDINLESNSGDWLHLNSIKYNPVLDQIIISSHYLDELYVIDHSTTTAQAATHSGGNSGHGGDILYRWGRAANYGVTTSAQVFNVVHHAHWIAQGLPGAGDIMAFNNREGTGQSHVVQITPPLNGYTYTLTPNQAYGPTASTWLYSAPGFTSDHYGGSQRLPNGNTLITQSWTGKLFEVTAGGTTVWSYTPGGQIPRSIRYAPTYPGLAQLPVELTSFRGVLSGASVRLQWTVSHQSNNCGFQVQRSFDDGMQWEQAGFVPGHGTTSDSREYTFCDAVTDRHRARGSVKYRLRQLDNDGAQSYSPVVEIAMSAPPSTAQLLQTYPNPLRRGTTAGMRETIDFYMHKDAPVTITIYDAMGREVATLADGIHAGGYSSVSWDAARAASGVYYCRLVAGADVDTRKLIVAGFGQ
jgi:hypothetical protein